MVYGYRYGILYPSMSNGLRTLRLVHALTAIKISKRSCRAGFKVLTPHNGLHYSPPPPPSSSSSSSSASSSSDSLDSSSGITTLLRYVICQHGISIEAAPRRAAPLRYMRRRKQDRLTNGVIVPMSSTTLPSPFGPTTSSSFSFRPMVKFRRRRRSMLGFSALKP